MDVIEYPFGSYFIGEWLLLIGGGGSFLNRLIKQGLLNRVPRLRAIKI
jgi:hypothetical protein